MIGIIRKIKDSDRYILQFERVKEWKTIFNDIPKIFSSVECLRGFVSGYGFNKIRVFTLDDYIEHNNSIYVKKLEMIIKAVTIIEED